MQTKTGMVCGRSGARGLGRMLPGDGENGHRDGDG